MEKVRKDDAEARLERILVAAASAEGGGRGGGCDSLPELVDEAGDVRH